MLFGFNNFDCADSYIHKWDNLYEKPEVKVQINDQNESLT